MGNRGGQESRRGGGWQTQRGGGLWNGVSKATAGRPSEVADCGMGQARLQLADTKSPHSCIDKPGGTAGERSRPCNPGLQRREIKPETSD